MVRLKGKKLSTNCVDDVTADVSDEDESVIVGNRRRPHRCALCHELSVLMCPFLQSKSIKDLRTVNETCKLLMMLHVMMANRLNF